MEQHDLSTELRLSRQPQSNFSRYKKNDMSRKLSPKFQIDLNVSTTVELKQRLQQLLVRYNKMKDQRKEREQLLVDKVQRLAGQLQNSTRKYNNMVEQSRRLKSQVEQSKYDLTGVRKLLDIQKNQNEILRKRLQESEKVEMQLRSVIALKDNEIRRLEATTFNHGPYIDKHLKSQYEMTKVLLIEKEAKCKDLERCCNKLRDELEEMRLTKEVGKIKRTNGKRLSRKTRCDQTLNRCKSVSYYPCHVRIN